VSKPDIRRAELETSVPPVLLTESKTTKEVSAGVTTPLATPLVATDAPVKSDAGGFTETRPSPVHNTQDTDDRLNLLIFKDGTPIELLISGLRKKTSFPNNIAFSAECLGERCIGYTVHEKWCTWLPHCY